MSIRQIFEALRQDSPTLDANSILRQYHACAQQDDFKVFTPADYDKNALHAMGLKVAKATPLSMTQEKGLNTYYLYPLRPLNWRERMDVLKTELALPARGARLVAMPLALSVISVCSILLDAASFGDGRSLLLSAGAVAAFAAAVYTGRLVAPEFRGLFNRLSDNVLAIGVGATPYIYNVKGSDMPHMHDYAYNTMRHNATLLRLHVPKAHMQRALGVQTPPRPNI